MFTRLKECMKLECKIGVKIKNTSYRRILKMKKYEDVKLREDLIIKITKIKEVNSKRVLARVDIVINNFIVITNIRIIQGKNNLFISMPQEKALTGTYYNIVYFLDKKIKNKIDDIILDKYFEERRK